MSDKWSELCSHDIYWCARRLPRAVFDLLKSNHKVATVAGGFIRSAIAHETINDIDIFSPTKDTARLLAEKLDQKPFTTENAYTARLPSGMKVQFIHRWTFESPRDIVPSFDFTIARAAMWWNGERWESMCSDRFYQDLAAKRLVYCSPVRNEDAGGSMLRVLKFYQRGYRIPLDSLGACIARLVAGIDQTKAESPYEQWTAKVVTGLLREVDPDIDPNHFSHLPSSQEAAEAQA